MKLNRLELVERRGERLSIIGELINKYHSVCETDIEKGSVLEQIKIEIDIDKPYSMCAKSLFDSMF